jgi:hypothetical protein
MIQGNDTKRRLPGKNPGGPKIGAKSTTTNCSEVLGSSSKHEPDIIPAWCSQGNQLPRISAPDGLTPAGSYFPEELLVENVIGAIQLGESAEVIQTHLAYFHQLDRERLRANMNTEMNGFPAIFYVVETGDQYMIRCWVRYGGNPNATCSQDHCPLLAFAIMHGGGTRTLQQATSTVEMLLVLGASPSVIPTAFYMPFTRSLPASGPLDKELDDMADEEKRWCVPGLRRELVSALNLTQRYRLFQAKQAGSPSVRQRILASRTDSERVLGLQYIVIGQDAAVRALKRRLMA